MVESVQSYALTNATVIDGHGGVPLNDAVIFIDNGVIKKVGKQASIDIGDEIAKIDVAGNFILPGLINNLSYECQVPYSFIGIFWKLFE